MGMGRLLRGREMAVGLAVEGRAPGGEVFDAVARFACHAERDLAIDDAAAGGDRVVRMAFGGVAFLDGGGDAALRPIGRTAGPDGRRGENGDRAGRELERAEDPREAAADDQDGWELVGHKLIERDGGELCERGGLFFHGGGDKGAGAVGQGKRERRRMAPGRHFAERLAQNVDDLRVVIAGVFFEKLVEIMRQEDNGRDILQRLRFGVLF